MQHLRNIYKFKECFSVILFWLIGPAFYCLAIVTYLVVPNLDWHIIRFIPIPEFQYRTNVLVPLGNGHAERYAIICFMLTAAFLNPNRIRVILH